MDPSRNVILPSVFIFNCHIFRIASVWCHVVVSTAVLLAWLHGVTEDTSAEGANERDKHAQPECHFTLKALVCLSEIRFRLTYPFSAPSTNPKYRLRSDEKSSYMQHSIKTNQVWVKRCGISIYNSGSFTFIFSAN